MPTRLNHSTHGQGTVLSDHGDILVVEFDSGIILKVLATETQPIAAPEQALQAALWGTPLVVATKLLAHAVRSTSDRWGVFSRSRVKLLPHQLWVAHRVLQRWPARWLIADDVGLGKTIEAGLILIIDRILQKHLYSQTHSLQFSPAGVQRLPAGSAVALQVATQRGNAKLTLGNGGARGQPQLVLELAQPTSQQPKLQRS